MQERAKLLIIDDDKTWQAIHMASLKDKYDVRTAFDGDSGLSCAYDFLPDTILLDIEMPGKDGYEVCKILKSSAPTKHIPIIFLSNKSSLQEKIIAFQLGADDYLVKPCEMEILSAKLKRSTQLHRDMLELNSKATSAQGIAFEALSSSADMGRSLRFAERTYTMHTYDKLAEGLFQTMSEFGLETSAMFVTSNGPLFYSHSKYELSPLERDMFLTVHQEGRFCDFDRRTFCNFKLVSLLIKNMPIEDPERYGRVKDTIPWILGAADGKVGALDVHNTLSEQHKNVAAFIDELNQKLVSVGTALSNSSQQIGESAALLVTDAKISRRGMDAEGEQKIIDSIDATYADASAQLDSNAQLKTELDSAVALLGQLAEEQERIMKIALKDEGVESAIELGADDIFSSDVDLF